LGVALHQGASAADVGRAGQALSPEHPADGRCHFPRPVRAGKNGTAGRFVHVISGPAESVWTGWFRRADAFAFAAFLGVGSGERTRTTRTHLRPPTAARAKPPLPPVTDENGPPLPDDV